MLASKLVVALLIGSTYLFGDRHPEAILLSWWIAILLSWWNFAVLVGCALSVLIVLTVLKHHSSASATAAEV
jgi:hypothetical protein